MPEKKKPIVSVVIISITLALVAAAGGAMAKIYATKTEVAELEKRVNPELQKWRMEKIEVQFENMHAEQKTTNDNVVRLMERWRVEPVSAPPPKPLPPAPKGVEE